MWVASSTKGLLTPTAVALGKFDGVHLGHHRVIQPVLHAGGQLSVGGAPRFAPVQQSNENQQLTTDPSGTLREPLPFENDFVERGTQSPESENPPAALSHQGQLTKEHTYSTVVTFHPHPQEFFTGQPRALLTPLDEKVQQLRSLGIEQLVLLPFDKELAALSPEEFVEKILVQQLQCQRISVGQDFCFGKQRRGTAKDLQLLAAKYDIPVTIVSLQTYTDTAPTQEIPISTSLIRHSLESGDLKNANLLLGRAYTLIGVVVQGQQLGRTIGFPTANLQLPNDKFIPCKGVYAVRVSILSESETNAPTETLGVMNIGDRPTVNGTCLSVEVHLFDWSSDLYGQKLAVQLVEFLRSEQKFPSLEALKTQIQLDCNVAREVLSNDC